jgi:ABC-type glycerol-3-phosphate transport system substrate-binding protein
VIIIRRRRIDVAKSLLPFILAALVLASCGGGKREAPSRLPPATATPAEVVTISFSPSRGTPARGPDPHGELRELATRFRETHPYIRVEIKPPEIRSGMDIQDIARDVECFTWYPRLRDPEAREVILNLQPFLESDPSFTTDDFYPSLLEPFLWEGRLWGLPSNAQPYIIKYNMDLFNAIGVSYPSAGWTIDDFLATAVLLTRGRGHDKQYGFVPAAFEFQELTLMLERLGAHLLDTTVDPPTLTLNAPSTAEALRWYVGLSTDHGVKPVFITDVADLAGGSEAASAVFQEREALIKEGRAAMWTLMESWELASEPEGLRVGVVPLPAGTGDDLAAYTSVAGYFISAHTEAPQACWQWLTYLTAQPEAAEGSPARRSVVQSEAFHQRVGAARAAAYEASLEGHLGISFQSFRDQDWLLAGYVVWLTRAYGQVCEGQASVEHALDLAQRAFDEYRACVIVRDALADEEKWQPCLIETDSSLAGLFPGE